MAHGLSLLLSQVSSRPRRIGLGMLVLFVLGVHGCVTQQVLSHLADIDAEGAMPPRMEVAYVRDMALATPPPTAKPAAPQEGAPVVSAKPVKVVKAIKPATPASAASAASAVLAAEAAPAPSPSPSPSPAAPVIEAAAPAALPPAVDEVGESMTLPRRAIARAPAASAPPLSAEAPAASATETIGGFEWPASTRISYGLTGNYRGEVNGNAQVEWIRAGARYQVHLDLGVGPSFAPLITRRMTSDGDITAEGLVPRRYDEDTKVVMRDRSRVTLRFEPGSVVLVNGERRDTLPGVQDTASQFVQLVYVFSTRPDLLRAGGTVDIPLALKNRVGVWTYDVIGEELLATPFGPLNSIHLKPRNVGQKPGELSIEIWFAPQLRYLPVRIRIQQDPQTFVDLMVSKRPELGQ